MAMYFDLQDERNADELAWARVRPHLPPGGSEPAVPAEALITALRTRDGLPSVTMLDASGPAALAWALDEGLLGRTKEDRLVLTRRGRLLSNEVFTRLF